MKKIAYIFLSILKITCLFSQNNDSKRDNVWLLGYDSAAQNIDTCYGNTKLNFEKKPLKSQFQYTDMNFSNDAAMICDTSGRLLCYTNGIYVADSTHQPMKNGKGLNPGEQANAVGEYGYICEQGSLLLPKPENNNLYYLIHTPVYLDTKPKIAEYVGEKLYYTLIDMSKNNGKGEVIEKNKVLYDQNYLDVGKITACRHANGIDWWIVVADYISKNYNVFLLSSQGIIFKSKQSFEKGQEAGVGQAVFSPDGSKYARLNSVSIDKGTFIDVFDFDRCNGVLSNQKEYSYKKDTAYAGGTAISPNSRYLYAFSYRKVYQFDLQAANIFANIDTVGVFDGVIPPEFQIPNHFFLAQLAPDGKIYVSVPGGSKYLHVVNEPNKKGKACNFVQRGFKLAGFNYTTMPNFPNFRLGKAAQPCITAVEEAEKDNIKIYPNPATSKINILYNPEKLQRSTLIISDIQGKAILQKALNDDKIDVSDFPNGIYFLQILNENKVVFREKVVILK
jgi:hypothetical protein